MNRNSGPLILNFSTLLDGALPRHAACANLCPLEGEKYFPGRTVATDLDNPDFKALAEAFGAKGMSIRTPEEAAGVVQEALDHDGPVVIDVASSLEQISAYTTLESLAAPGANKGQTKNARQ